LRNKFVIADLIFSFAAKLTDSKKHGFG